MDKQLYRRTYVQKIMYFVSPEELRKDIFIPYLYGPYSPGVQRVIQYLEQNQDLIDVWKKEEIPKNLKYKIDKLVDFIKRKNISVNDISLLAKIHYLLSESDTQNDEEFVKLVKQKSIILGWTELSKLEAEEILSVKRKLKEIIDVIHANN